MKKTKIISIISLKGGSGKTSITNLFLLYLLNQNKKVLLLNTDIQNNIFEIWNIKNEKKQQLINSNHYEIFYKNQDNIKKIIENYKLNFNNKIFQFDYISIDFSQIKWFTNKNEINENFFKKHLENFYTYNNEKINTNYEKFIDFNYKKITLNVWNKKDIINKLQKNNFYKKYILQLFLNNSYNINNIEILKDLIKRILINIKNNIKIENSYLKNYDYILIDNLPIGNQITYEMLKVSNKILNIINLNKFSINSLNKLNIFYNNFEEKIYHLVNKFELSQKNENNIINLIQKKNLEKLNKDLKIKNKLIPIFFINQNIFKLIENDIFTFWFKNSIEIKKTILENINKIINFLFNENNFLNKEKLEFFTKQEKFDNFSKNLQENKIENFDNFSKDFKQIELQKNQENIKKNIEKIERLNKKSKNIYITLNESLKYFNIDS